MPATETAREELRRQAADAARRYGESATERERVEERLAAGTLFPDAPETLAVRAERILDRGGVSSSAVVSSIHAEVLGLPEANERIINLSNELQAWSFLPRGTRAAGTVARITVRHAGREIPHGTGFLVSPRLLMTNHHVLPDEGFAGRCFLEFNAQVTIDNVPDSVIRMEFDPGTFFTADKRLDFALVAVAPAVDGRLPGEVFGWNRLSAQVGNLVIGERVNIIGHPNGRLKEIALRDNTLLVRLDEFVHYKTDTEPGNSGSPVFNDQWEVVALHHSGVPRTDAQGRVLRKDGQLWQRGDGDEAIDWIANEGVRISSILKHLAALSLDPVRRTLLAELGPDSSLGQGIRPVTKEAPVPPLPAQTAGAMSQRGTPVPEAAAATVTAAAAVPATGLRARGSAFDSGKRHLVFLHGRSQHRKDPKALRREWTAGLNHGLTRAGMATVDPADVWFPYYGDRLAALMGWTEAVSGAIEFGELTAASAAERFAAESPSGFYEQMLVEAANRAGMPQDGPVATEGFGNTLVGRFQQALSWLAAKTDADEWTIATVFGDVSRYLSDRKVRDTVLDTVLETMPTSGELVLVTHSLGTVVGVDLISRPPDALDLTLLVTAGSPLGMNAVNERLLAGGPHRPEKARQWFNAWCPTDAVAIGCPLEDPRWGKVTQLAVANARDRAHNIDEYLAHRGVANEIGGALHQP
ncbi:trypsin-like peptidase domain-containing protein [Streptomyces sp. ISL-96]|uniref:trypsin-like serine peptidase n=1 Tax=Streptomyces sp. ISL-96 TaxID=2819191 RepID=UPI001BECD3E0|nr:serine protease [Streptomyces sp. ISL-96]MBT2492068.1 trypsin-like peptidase domain-containing protein [Streptomyces sp. ISL-96]